MSSPVAIITGGVVTTIPISVEIPPIPSVPQSDILGVSSNWLRDRQKEFRGTNIDYHRDLEVVTVTATIDSTEFESYSQYGILEKTQSRDFLIHANDLIIGGDYVKPEAGDLIRESGADGKIHVYEVMVLGGNRPWRYGDNYRKTYRVHTKEVKVE